MAHMTGIFEKMQILELRFQLHGFRVPLRVEGVGFRD